MLILYGIAIEFESGYDQYVFRHYDDTADHKDLVNTLKYLQRMNADIDVIGNITLTAWQVGGEPEKLS